MAQGITGLVNGHGPLGLEHIREVSPLDVLHDDEWCVVLEGAHPMHGRYVVMVDLRSGSSFSLEAFPRGVIFGHLRIQNLDHYQTLERLLPSQVYVCHGSLAQHADDLKL